MNEHNNTKYIFFLKVRYMYTDEKFLDPDPLPKEIFAREHILNKLKTIDIITEHPNPTNPHALSNSQKIYKRLEVAMKYKRRAPNNRLRGVYYYHPQNEYSHKFYPKKIQY